MKKICRWMLAFCLAFALGTLAASAADTVYVKDGGTGDGTSALSPLGDLADAIRAVSGGGKVVLVGDTSVAKSAGYDASVGAFTAPATGGTLTLSSEGGARLVFPDGGRFFCTGDTTFENITFYNAHKKTLVVAGRFFALTFGKGVTMDNIEVHVVGGMEHTNATVTVPDDDYSRDAHITLESGRFAEVTGLGRNTGKASFNPNYTGAAYITISGDATVDKVFGAFRWGVWSAAVATVLSQGTSCVLCLIHLLKKGEVYTVTPRNIRFHTGMLGEIVRYGLPSGIQNCVIGLANVIVQSQINSFGMLAMAAYGAHCKIEGFAFLPITSFTMACTTFVGQNLGAKQYDRAKRGARFCIIIAVVMAELIGLCYYIWASQLISLFDSTPGVVALGVQQARTVALFYCLLAFSHSIAAVCRGAGRAVVPMMIMLSVWCVIRIIYIMLVVRFIGEIGYIYWAYPLTWAISSTIYLIYYLRSDWVHGFER